LAFDDGDPGSTPAEELSYFKPTTTKDYYDEKTITYDHCRRRRSGFGQCPRWRRATITPERKYQCDALWFGAWCAKSRRDFRFRGRLVQQLGFTQAAIEAVGGDWRQIRDYNDSLIRLRDRRKTEITASGPLRLLLASKPKIAWKIAVLQQVLLYRVTMLATGCADMWNAQNLLSAILSARALIETVAVIDYVRDEITRLLASNDLDAIDALVTKETFSTRNPKLLETAPETQAINALTLVDRLAKRRVPSMRTHYDSLSEWCHPNSNGHFITFADLDIDTGTVSFAETRRYELGMLHHIMAAFMLIRLVENWMDEIDALVLRVSAAQAA
jgi:hypothetical protein